MTDKDVTNHIAVALVKLRDSNPDLTAEQVLRALETLRFKITEDLLKVQMK